MNRFTLDRSDDDETIRLELVAALQQLSQERGMATDRGEGYWLDSWGADAALIRWIEGGVEEPPFAKVELDKRRALIKPEADIEHPVILDICENLGLEVYIVEGFVRAECAKCGGQGYHVHEYGYTVTGSGFGDACPDEEIVDCSHCKGMGVLR